MCARVSERGEREFYSSCIEKVCEIVLTCVSDEPETRDAWWEEIRQEIKSHAKALGCHAVVGYSESTSIW